MIILPVIAVVAVGYAVYKHLTVSNVKAEVSKIEAELKAGVFVTDAKAVLARIKAKL